MERLGLYTKLTALPGQRDRLVATLLRAASLMERASGCVLYVVNIAADDPAAVWVTEVWDGEQEHRDSLALAGVSELIQEAMPLLSGAPEQVRLVSLGGKGVTA